MKYLLPILIIVPLAVVVFTHNRRSLADAKWQDTQTAMQDISRFLKQPSVIGCPVDSNHVRDYYECRYLLAPAVLIQANSLTPDTQLIIAAHDERPVRMTLSLAPADTIRAVHTPHISCYLVKKSR